jgi:hypothetical protein
MAISTLFLADLLLPTSAVNKKIDHLFEASVSSLKIRFSTHTNKNYWTLSTISKRSFPKTNAYYPTFNMEIGVFIPIGNNGWLISETAQLTCPRSN